MLKATEEEIEEVREYFEWQAPDLEVTFMQKVYSEAVLNTRHDVWDIHTNKDRCVRRQNIWRISRRKLAECGPRLGVDVRRQACGAASADVRWSVA